MVGKVKKVLISFASTMMVTSLTLSAVLPVVSSARNALADGNSDFDIRQIDGLKNDLSDYYDPSVVQKLPETVADNQEISVIVKMSADSLLDVYEAEAEKKAVEFSSVGEYAASSAGRKVASGIAAKGTSLRRRISKAGIDYTLGNEYNVLFGGFEINVRAKDFDRLNKLIGDEATLIVGAVYEKCETKVVENDVSVYDTGIFDSSDSKYDGSGTVIAVLDTGLDYTHTAFDVRRFNGKETMTVSSIAGVINQTRAAGFSSGLSAEDVYMNAKIPFAYDYADKDPDVAPIASEHGTHVSGVIVGNDDTITGVAPNAQLVSMKVFSDTTDGARTSWLLAALEDCTVLGVDVINMSLGSSSGFTREVDEVEVQTIYDRIGDQGISLICAASNDYNSTFGSEKNGNLGLTSNPDSATVGSPSTYESSLSVASVSGVKTPYLMYGDTVIYFREATGRGAKSKDFVNELLPAGVAEQNFEYLTIPGVGRSADYTGLDVTGKIALVKRGDTSFEDKARVAKTKGAAGIIIYNNVSGDIGMTVGSVEFPVCSISQDNGTILTKDENGKIKESGVLKISRNQKAGPFMSDFSSWGPTPDLRIKPEITAHGGEILSAVPGQAYDRLSGTSMAAPNQAGVTALVRQYVKETFPGLSATEVTARVNQLMMSTADIVYNTNGLPYSVRKQGSGLANLTKTTTTKAFLSTYDRKSGEVMDKAKLELGDDPEKSGVYSMKFAVNNIGTSALSYNVKAIVQTEGVAETLTNQGQTTVTEQGYLLSPSVKVISVENGSSNGNSVTVEGGKSAVVTVEITLSDADKEYLNKSFENGMYVEGFVMLESNGLDVDLNVPFLAFYGDWTQAPLFDLDYFATNKDELDDSIDLLDKTLPDAYATRPIGGLYNDYIVYLGSYAYVQDPSAAKIAADRKYIALSNQATGDTGSTAHSISSVWAGMLRGAKKIEVTVTDSTTGEVIYTKLISNQRKSYSRGSSITQSSVDIDFDLANYNLKNNTQYIFKMQGYLDYGDGGLKTNKRNTFEFPFVVDFEAPAVTDCKFRTEYDEAAKRTRIFADISIYDNHYSQAAAIGYITPPAEGETLYGLNTFDRYLSALYSDFNSSYTLSYELTDHLDTIKSSSYNGNSFIVQVMDYASNTATYEIAIPDSVASIYFTQNQESTEPITSVTLSPNETYRLNAVVAPEGAWADSLNYTTSDPEVVRIVNGKLIALKSGTAEITATSNANSEIKATLEVKVLSEGEEGYVEYTKPVADEFKLTGYTLEKVFYFMASEDRDLGGTEAGQNIKFAGNNYALSMFPSEAVTIEYLLKAYFPEETRVEFISSDPSIVSVDENGKITAIEEGNSSIRVQVLQGNKPGSFYSQTINITVKNPYETSAIYLMRYTGNGGVVEIPDDLGITEISQYAFPGYKYVPKDENDEISEEDPFYSKPMPIGDDTITKVVVPEGVETIGRYAFANLTALKEVVLPSTVKKLEVGAFENCTSLATINLENVQFINKNAFKDCLLSKIKLDSIVAIGNEAFSGNPLLTLTLPVSAQSIGSGAFYANKYLQSVEIAAEKVKLGTSAFASCTELRSIDINASVVPAGVFDGCTHLENVTLGKDVSVIGTYAFRNTGVKRFEVKPGNVAGITVSDNGLCLLSENGTKVLLAVPNVTNFRLTAAETQKIVEIGDSAFAGNAALALVNLPNVTKVGNYAFADCEELVSARLTLALLTDIGDYAFAGCSKISSLPGLAVTEDSMSIGNYAFFATSIQSVTIPDKTNVGAYAFAACPALASVEIGDYAVLNEGAFCAALAESGYAQVTDTSYYTIVYNYATSLTKVSIGDYAVIGDHAFRGATALTDLTIGDGAAIGDYAFYANRALTEVDLSAVKSIGAYAFSGHAQGLYRRSVMSGVSNFYALGVIINSYAPRFVNVDIGDCIDIGEGAFAYCMLLENVVLNEAITKVADGLFFYCLSLKEIDFTNITEIGNSAFYYCQSLGELDLSNVDSIGDGAFFRASDVNDEAGVRTGITSVTLKEGVTIGSAAFRGIETLETINLGVASSIGAYAFANDPALLKADLTSAVSVGAFAFMDSGITSVVLGDKLETIGDNPFVNCAIGEFTNEKGETDFAIEKVIDAENDVRIYPVTVSDGVLYCLAPNGGTVLVSYPMLKADKVFTVKAGTIRIAARAFESSAVVSVELPYEMKAIGDKAFYNCKDLRVVVFKSIAAPILEEEYDENYMLYTNLPQTGETTLIDGSVVEGLKIVPYKMWGANATIFYYGANFVEYIGKPSPTLTMVRPLNGTGYENFIYNKYFSTCVDGATVPYQETLDVIEMIKALPANITLNDEAQINAVRDAYNKLTTEQQALVSNIDNLISAENYIEWLKSLEPVVPEPQPAEEKPFNYKPVIITLSVLTGVFAALAVTGGVLLVFTKKKRN